MNLDELYETIQSRLRDKPQGSYVASLSDKGLDAIIQKYGEEAVEVVIAAKNGKKDELVAEVADSVFHLLLLCAALNVTPAEIMAELESRKR
jgi:phosphoribosyl-ATP pyrophosphohydrolase